MSYTVIARRWRPKKFEDVIGQAHIVTTLKNSIKNGRLAHAYLFSGPRGVGKTSVSRILAKAVNCLEGVREEPCNACHVCKSIDAGGFVDVIEIDAASNRGIDEIRELRETVRYLPMEARYKVYIIDEAHMLTEPAFNALLKTLEEPPGHNIFILATTENQKIPYTIMSRCQRFDFRRISEAHIIDQLKRICGDEGVEYDEKVLNYVVREADGSLRDAESILDQVIAYSGKHVTETDAIDVIGVVQREVAYGMVRSVVEKDPRAGLELIGRTLEQGHDAYQVYRGLLSFLRDILMIKMWNGKPPFVFMDDEEYAKAIDLLKEVEYYELQNMVHHLLQAEDLVRGAFPKISLEVLFINLYNLTQLKDVEEMLERLPQGAARQEPGARGSGSREPAPSRAAGGARAEERTPAGPAREIAPSEDVGGDEETWGEPHIPAPSGPAPFRQDPAPPPENFAQYLKEKNTMLFGLFGAFEMRVEGDSVVITLDKRRSAMKNDAAIVNELKRYASEFFGREMTIRLVDGSEPKADTIDDYMREAELLFRV
jgi:DNA polymerase-3 subunit gamma/tau